MVLEDGFEPPARTFSGCRSYLLSYSSVLTWTRPRESNALVAVLQTAAFPFGQVGIVAIGTRRRTRTLISWVRTTGPTG